MAERLADRLIAALGCCLAGMDRYIDTGPSNFVPATAHSEQSRELWQQGFRPGGKNSAAQRSQQFRRTK